MASKRLTFQLLDLYPELNGRPEKTIYNRLKSTYSLSRTGDLTFSTMENTLPPIPEDTKVTEDLIPTPPTSPATPTESDVDDLVSAKEFLLYKNEINLRMDAVGTALVVLKSRLDTLEKEGIKKLIDGATPRLEKLCESADQKVSKALNQQYNILAQEMTKVDETFAVYRKDLTELSEKVQGLELKKNDKPKKKEKRITFNLKK